MTRHSCPLDRDWAFRYDPQPEPARHAEEEPGWMTISLPHTWHTWETTGQVHPFTRDPSEIDDPYWWLGWGSYRKRLRVDGLPAGRRVFLECDAIQTAARLLVNGSAIAEHRGGYASFCWEIGEALVPGDNEILIQVNARRDATAGIPPMTAGNWNIYGGIYRSIRLVTTGPVCIPFAGNATHPGGVRIDQRLDGDTAHLALTTWIDAGRDAGARIGVRHRLLDASGACVWEDASSLELQAGLQQHRCDGTLTPAHRWSPTDPHCYSLHTGLLDGAGAVDRLTTTVGLRSISWDHADRRLLLDGEAIRLIGGNRHQEWPWLGDALPGNWWHEYDLRELRERLGHNFMRFCHYTQDPFVYDWCDRHGMLVFEEVPNIKSLPFAADVQRQQVIEMVRRDHHHPCIVGWSMGNETANPADGAWALAEDRSRIIHYRHVSWRDRPRPEPLHDHEQLELENVLRCSVRGWFDDEVAERHPADGQRTCTEHFQFDQATTSSPPGRPALGTTGNLVTWVHADHGADREYGQAPLLHVNPKGWVDCYRIPKYIAARWQAAYTRPLMVQAQPDAWRPRHLGTRRRITVSSNAERVELWLEGALLGSSAPGAENGWCGRFDDVPVRAAPLRIVGIRGTEHVEQVLEMPGSPVALRLTSLHEELPADRAACALLHLEAVDAAGLPVQGYRADLHWRLEGPGRLLAPDHWTSDHGACEAREGFWYIDLPIRLPVRATAEAGTITVHVSSGTLRPGVCTLTSHAVAIPSLPGLTPLAEPDRARPAPPVRPCSHGTLAMPIVHGDRRLSGSDHRAVIEGWFSKVDASVKATAPYRQVVDDLVALFTLGDGFAIADDINTTIMAGNRQLLSERLAAG